MQSSSNTIGTFMIPITEAHKANLRQGQKIWIILKNDHGVIIPFRSFFRLSEAKGYTEYFNEQENKYGISYSFYGVETNVPFAYTPLVSYTTL